MDVNRGHLLYLKGFIQVLIGLGLYFGLVFQRIYSKDAWKECDPCTFIRNPSCPGFSPFNFEPEPQKTIWSVDVPLDSR